MTRSREESRRPLILGLLLAAAVVVANVTFVSAFLGFRHTARQVKESDHHNYIAMTRAWAFGEESPGARTAPYCWRMGVPAAAAGLTRLGLSGDAAYHSLTLLALTGFSFGLFLLLRARGCDDGLAALGVLLVGLTPGAVRWYTYQYWMTDPAALALIVLGLLLVERRAWRSLAVVSLLGLLTRETYVLVLAYAFVHEWRTSGRRRALSRVGAVAAVPVLALLAVRLLVVPEVGGGTLPTLRFVLGFRWRHLLDNQLYLATFGTFGVLLPLLLLWPRRVLAVLRRAPEQAVLVTLTCASLALAVNTERLLVYALPVVVPLALEGLTTFCAETRLRLASVGAVALALQALLYVETSFVGRRALSIYQPASLTVTIALVGAWLVALVLLRVRRAAPA